MFWTPYTKEYLHKQYALHHSKHRKEDGDGYEFMFHPEGGQDPCISLSTFTNYYPSDVKSEKWHKCVCQTCYVANLVLEDVLNALKGMHGAGKYASHNKGIRGKCQNKRCPWHVKQLPEATSNRAQACLDKKEKVLPFLLCGECRCFSPLIEALNSSRLLTFSMNFK